MAQLSIIHYNDVYNVDPNSSKEPIGGAARFLTAVKSFDHLDPLILFSGDAFSPSMRKLNTNGCNQNWIHFCFFRISVSTFTKGEQMVPVLNRVGTHCAVLGNHDFGKFSIFIFSQWNSLQIKTELHFQCRSWSGGTN